MNNLSLVTVHVSHMVRRLAKFDCELPDELLPGVANHLEQSDVANFRLASTVISRIVNGTYTFGRFYPNFHDFRACFSDDPANASTLSCALVRAREDAGLLNWHLTSEPGPPPDIWYTGCGNLVSWIFQAIEQQNTRRIIWCLDTLQKWHQSGGQTQLSKLKLLFAVILERCAESRWWSGMRVAWSAWVEKERRIDAKRGISVPDAFRTSVFRSEFIGRVIVLALSSGGMVQAIDFSKLVLASAEHFGQWINRCTSRLLETLEAGQKELPLAFVRIALKKQRGGAYLLHHRQVIYADDVALANDILSLAAMDSGRAEEETLFSLLSTCAAKGYVRCSEHLMGHLRRLHEVRPLKPNGTALSCAVEAFEEEPTNQDKRVKYKALTFVLVGSLTEFFCRLSW